MPRYRFLFQVFGTLRAFTSVDMSGWRESATRSAGRPAITARACSPELPYDCVKDASSPAGVSVNSPMIFPNASLGVE